MRPKRQWPVTRSALAAGVVVWVAVAAWVIACLDLTPYVVEQAPPQIPDVYVPPEPDVSPIIIYPDADADAEVIVIYPDVDKRPPCQYCIETTCSMLVQACEALPLCAATYTCSVGDNCLLLPTPQLGLACVLPCAAEAGLNSQQDPPGMALINLAYCALNSCPACWPEREGGAD